MIDLRLWARALQGMPRVDAATWRGLDPVARWLIVSRASVLFMTFTAAALGGLLAWRSGASDWILWSVTALGLVFAHASNNLLNDYTDSRNGVDKDNYFRNQYGVHVLEQGFMSRAEFWRYFAFTAGIAIALGLWVVGERSGITLQLMLAGAFFVLFYTWPLKYIGLGEPSVLLVWGPLMVGGTYYVLTGTWSWPVAWLSLVFALGPTAVLFGKHTDKLEMDRAKGVGTLPVLIGEARSRHCVLAMLVSQYVLCLLLVLSGSFGWPLLLVAVTVWQMPALVRAYSAPRPPEPPADYPAGVWPLWFSAFAFRQMRNFTSVFLLAVVLDSLL